jgi:predicted Fe-Mo cluster-binding NifX family protein
MISGGRGGRAIGFFDQYGIQVATGASGKVSDVIQAYLDGKLSGAAPCIESVDHGH